MVDIASGFFTIIGIGIGFLLTEWSYQRKEKKQIKSVRYLFVMEINSNLNLLNELIKKIKENIEPNQEDYGLEIIDLPFPQFKYVIWENQNLFLISAFNEHDIKKIQEFYNSLDLLKSIYNHMKISINEDKSKRYSTIPGLITRSSGYSGDFKDFSKEFMNVSETLIKEKNPIESYLDL